eukprot:4742174-Alexandrium_andersonii.AAC.1
MRGPPLQTLNNCARVFRELWKDGKLGHIKPYPTGTQYRLGYLGDCMTSCGVELIRDLFGSGESER